MVDQGAYYFVASDGRRGDIVKCQTHQPEIQNGDDYFYYMWVKAIQGYFVLKQQFLEGQAQQWYLIGEVETEETSPAFFDELTDHLLAQINSL